MKLQDFDFRLYVVSAKDYVRDEDKYQILADLKAKSEYIERNALKEPQVEVEFFTGFYDKNKKQIYEGDILKCWNDNYYESKDDPYASGSIAIPLAEHEKTFDFFAIQFDKELGFASKDLLTLSYIIVDYDCVEVVGNIHENPELLGERNESK